jgi:predicted GNAT family acetyltransferase
MSDAGLAAPSGRIEARPLHVSERDAACARLAGRARHNLLLLDMADRVGALAAPGEMPSEVVVARRDGALVALAALRPSLVLEPEVEPGVLEALGPFLDAISAGLVKTALPAADALWQRISRGGRRRAVVDRIETAYAVEPAALRPVPPGGVHVRPATRTDLDDLVSAARESLREEGRPDPFHGDPRGFRRWVRGRIPRALLVESGGRVVFVGYADVQRPEGWLIQGVYTWPEVRRRGFAAAGVAALCQQAFAAGAEHVQLAVVDGNEPGRRLYETLGFQPFAKLRTILFT